MEPAASSKKSKRSLLRRLLRKPKSSKKEKEKAADPSAVLQPADLTQQLFDFGLEDTNTCEKNGSSVGQADTNLPSSNPDEWKNGAPAHDDKDLGQSDFLRAEKVPDLPSCYCRHGSDSSNHEPKIQSRNHRQLKTCRLCGRCERCAGKSFKGSDIRCSGCATRSPLLSLPVELIQHISSFLDIGGAWLFRLSSRIIYDTTPVPAPTILMDPLDRRNFLTLIRSMIPWHLELCISCSKYHPWTFKDTYRWKDKPLCLRWLDRSEEANAQFAQTNLFVCRHCHFVRQNRKCKTCGQCEKCAGVRFEGLGSFPGPVGVECIPCDAGKARCYVCKKLRLRHRGCAVCGKCEKCARILFQFGRTRCWGCGGDNEATEPRMRRVAVESGPGYELFYTGGERLNEERNERIGIR